MSTVTDFYSTLNTVKKVLAADFACKESDFDTGGVFIHHAKEMPGRRRFPFHEKSFSVATMGRGVVVSCNVERLGWSDATLSRLSRNDIFGNPAINAMDEYLKKDGQEIAGPSLVHIGTRDIFQPFYDVPDVQFSYIEGDKQLNLYKGQRFKNALGLAPNSLRPRVVVAVAKCGKEIAGVAAASADCDEMWQIGVDTLPDYRHRGIGKALVSKVTEVVLTAGKIPYYAALESNTASKALIASLGFKTAWVELFSRDIKA
jgi:hypothetical protein